MKKIHALLFAFAFAVGVSLTAVAASDPGVPNSFADFEKSAKAAGAEVPAGLSEPLRAMWHAKAGHWEPAHEIAQDIKTPTGSWIHAFLHREEGDLPNARYWYRRAGKTMPENLAIADEWSFIARELWQAEHGIAAGEEAVTSATGLVAASTKSTDEEEGAWDTVIHENGKPILRITNARPVSFSPAGDVLLLREAAADDDARHFLIKPSADTNIPPFGERKRIGGRFTVSHEWSEDGKSLTLISDPDLDDSKADAIPVAEHLTQGS